MSVEENIPPSSLTLLHIRALDNDIGLNGAVTYSFNLQTATLHGGLFSIDNSTGEISTRGVIDYEESSIYRLDVVARDRGLDSVPVTTTAVINVVDVNDNALVVKWLTLCRRETWRTCRRTRRMGLSSRTWQWWTLIAGGTDGSAVCWVTLTSNWCSLRRTTPSSRFEFIMITSIAILLQWQYNYL